MKLSFTLCVIRGNIVYLRSLLMWISRLFYLWKLVYWMSLMDRYVFVFCVSLDHRMLDVEDFSECSIDP